MMNKSFWWRRKRFRNSSSQPLSCKLMKYGASILYGTSTVRNFVSQQHFTIAIVVDSSKLPFISRPHWIWIISSITLLSISGWFFRFAVKTKIKKIWFAILHRFFVSVECTVEHFRSVNFILVEVLYQVPIIMYNRTEWPINDNRV